MNQIKSQSISILIADSHSLFRDGLRLFIDSVADFELVGEVDNAVDVVSFSEKLNPDIILINIDMPPSNGIQAIKKILAKNPDTKIIILTELDTEDNVFKALKAGAKGYLLKGLNHKVLLESIRLVAKGSVVYGNNIAELMREHFSKIELRYSVYFTSLTPRENQVLTLVSQGLKNKEIATQCNIQNKTVRNYVTNILSKLQVNTRGEAIAMCQRKDLTLHNYENI